MADKYIVGLGEVLLDCFPNKNNEYTDENKRLGGAPAIFAYHADQSKFGGLRGIIVSAIGKDKDGEKIKDKIIKEHKMEISYLHEDDILPSGTVTVNNSDPNNPQYTIKTDAAWSAIPFTDELMEIAHKTAAVYYGCLASYSGATSRETVDKFLKATSSDCLKIFDVNLRFNPDNNGQYTEKLFNEELVDTYTKNCNILKVNLDELEYLCNKNGIVGGERKKCRELMRAFENIRLLIVTMGDDGSSVFWRENGEIAFSSLGMPVKVENTVGAGDALAGAFIGELLRRGRFNREGKSSLIKQLLGEEQVDANEELSLGKILSSIHHTAVRRSAIVCEEGESMPQINQYNIFISYSRKDEDIVKKVFCKKFEEESLTVWVDKQEIRCGDDFPPMIEQAIRNCDVVVYFSSKDANKSPFVTKEIQCAFENNKKIIPIKLDDAKFNRKINSILKDLDHLDYTVTKLISSIQLKMS